MHKRIIFLDLMRAFAVLMMVQGHTIDMLLSPQYRVADSFLYYGWNFMRGMTAPRFLFTAGTVFTYLFILHNKKAKDNPRLRKGLNRFLLLVFLGYLLHYPTAKIIDFSSVTPEQWSEFFAVDVLQLIGFGILFLIILYGSAWNLGVSILMADSFDMWRSIGGAIMMIFLMIGMVISIRMIKLRTKVIIT